MPIYRDDVLSYQRDGSSYLMSSVFLVRQLSEKSRKKRMFTTNTVPKMEESFLMKLYKLL